MKKEHRDLATRAKSWMPTILLRTIFNRGLLDAVAANELTKTGYSAVVDACYNANAKVLKHYRMPMYDHLAESVHSVMHSKQPKEHTYYSYVLQSLLEEQRTRDSITELHHDEKFVSALHEQIKELSLYRQVGTRGRKETQMLGMDDLANQMLTKMAIFWISLSL